MRNIGLILSVCCLVVLAGCNPSSIDQADGTIDKAVASEASPNGAVQPHELSELIDHADKMMVQETYAQGSKVIFESSDRRDFDALKSALKLELPSEYVHCMCNGNPAIVLYRDGKEIGWLTNHHAKRLRSNLWKSDVTITDVEKFLTWFDKRKISQPRDEFQAGLKQGRESNAAHEKWIEAMPVSLRPHWASASQSALNPEIMPLQAALEREFPEKNQRILALFEWFGSGTGKWSGYPVYECVAEAILLDYSTSDLLNSVETKPLTVPQIEGVARLFAGWSFSQQRPEDVDKLPSRFKQELLHHCELNDDDDKLNRARAAFGEP